MCTSRSACAYVRMSTVSFVVNACGLWKKKKNRKGVFLFCSGLLPLLEGGRTGPQVLGDEGSLGEEAAFLFLGLAIDGDLNCHLGCVLEDGVSRIQQIFLILLEHT